MRPERWFAKELSLIDPTFYATFNERRQRWEIRKKTSDKDLLIMRVSQYDGWEDIGYHPLDRRVLHALKLSKFNRENPSVCLQAVDEANAKLEQEATAEVEDRARTVGNQIWRHFRTKTVY